MVQFGPKNALKLIPSLRLESDTIPMMDTVLL